MNIFILLVDPASGASVSCGVPRLCRLLPMAVTCADWFRFTSVLWKTINRCLLHS